MQRHSQASPRAVAIDTCKPRSEPSPPLRHHTASLARHAPGIAAAHGLRAAKPLAEHRHQAARQSRGARTTGGKAVGARPTGGKAVGRASANYEHSRALLAAVSCSDTRMPRPEPSPLTLASPARSRRHHTASLARHTPGSRAASDTTTFSLAWLSARSRCVRQLAPHEPTHCQPRSARTRHSRGARPTGSEAVSRTSAAGRQAEPHGLRAAKPLA